MQMFQGLTPDEQQTIMNQVGSGGALAPGTTALTFGQSLGNMSQSQMQLQQQRISVRETRAQQEQQPEIPVLQGEEDWVIVEIGAHPAPRAPTATPMDAAALQQALSLSAITAEAST